MAPSDASIPKLRATLDALREKLRHLSGGRGLNEETTKATLIVPLLQALGWDTTNPEEVHYEYRRRPKDNPVDFALMLQRTPCLFVEAKALGENLKDRRWTNQAISYSTQSGVGWVVLTNGVEYHVYNAHAPVPLEGKLFKRLSISDTPPEELVRDLSLLSKDDFVGNRIDRAWDAHHVDTQVKGILTGLLAEDECEPLARLISRKSEGKLSLAAVKGSLQRADVRIDFPPAPLSAGTAEENDVAGPTGSGPAVGLADLIRRGVLRPPTELVAEYRGHRLSATVTPEGEIEMNGERYGSPSTAAGMARLPHFEGDLKGRPYPQTNGWTFWRVNDPDGGELVELDVLRRRLDG